MFPKKDSKVNKQKDQKISVNEREKDFVLTGSTYESKTIPENLKDRDWMSLGKGR
ncbi:hypothetical protein [Sinanaerobacter chloroacetimidivorans]|uniref:Uncharacterized protein n=1 Tax=Sinanaerobacter chloroacetimidivorans TaxID=2818044 RepID=A0A8J8B105_9FIRM|nr:hypothetical protein [Sinanaerobacter chloroacetimidivorans]MBR0597161.1 hypothetical protein [Sinanaerobacter chloroacetimidivorans]